MNQRHPSREAVTAAVTLVFFVAGLIWASAHLGGLYFGERDFLVPWAAAHVWLVEGASPYGPEAKQAIQEQVESAGTNSNRESDVFLGYPLTAMLFFGPVGLLDYSAARIVWRIVIMICLLTLVLVCMRLAGWHPTRWKAVAVAGFSITWLHGLHTILAGQFASINALLVGVSILLIVREQDIGAGFALALATAKPQMILLVAPFILFWAVSVRRWQIVYGFFALSGVLALISFLLVPRWMMDLFTQSLDYLEGASLTSPLTTIASAAPGIGPALTWALYGLVAGYLLFEWTQARGKNLHWFVWTAVLTLVLTNMLLVASNTANYILMLPAIFLVFRVIEERWGNTGRVAVWAWMWFLFAGIWLAYFSGIRGDGRNGLIILSLPAYCLISLWWVRWWAIRAPRGP